MKWMVKFTLLCSLGTGAIFLAGWAATSTDMGLDTNGWIALGLGVGFTILLAAGLMAAMFYSSRSGVDEQVYREFESPRGREQGRDGGNREKS